MSLTMSESLLQQYNQFNKKQETPIIDTRADDVGGLKLATWSYANMYDALYDKYSKNKNFNINMWRDAINAGEQDQYLAFLEANKDNTLSNAFYDPTHYNYEQMMLELYLPFANKEDKEERFESVYDEATGKWVETSIGEMSEYDYIKRQLDATTAAKNAEIERQYEQISKDRMEWYEKLGTGFVASVSEFGEGVAQSLAGLVDTIVSTFYATGAAFGGQDWGDAFVEYFGEKGLLANEQATLRAWLNEYERKYTDFRNLDGELTGWGKYLGNTLNSLGMMVPAIVAGILTSGASTAATTTALGSTMLGSSAAGIGAATAAGGAAVGSKVFYASIFANNMYDNANNPEWHGQPAYKVITNAGVKAAAEAVVEWRLGKVLGGTLQNSMLGIRGNGNSLKDLTKAFTKTAGAKYVLKSGGQEALEEILQDFSTTMIDEFTELWAEGFDADGLDFQALIDAGITGFISSIFLSGASVVGNSIRDKKSGGFYIDTKDGPKQIKGLNRIYFGAVMQDFNSAIDQLKNTGFSAEKNMRLAKDVFGAVTVLSDFYSTFDKQRLKNCELLLDRISKAESQKEAALEAGVDLETYNEYSEFDKKVAAKFAKDTDTYSQQRTIEFASALEASFNEMVYGSNARAIKYFADRDLDKDKKLSKEKQKKTSAKLKRVAAERQKELKDAGVTDITSASNDGVVYTRNSDIESIEEELGAKAASRYDELCKDYEWVFTTDGHIALEDVDENGNKILFVSENWLKNYETSEIYRFIVQTNLIKMLETIPGLSSMFENVTKSYREFSKNAKATKNEAIMQFLFDEKVYQNFLLSQNGKNLHKYKKFIFRLHTLIKSFVTQSGYLVHAGKPSPKRQNLLNQVYDKIKEAWRKPTLKAILNWNMTSQDIGADNILTDADLEFVDQYSKRKQSLLGSTGGASKSAYSNLKEDITTNTLWTFKKRELDIIERGLKDDADPRDALLAFALLDEADIHMEDDLTSATIQEITPLRELAKEINKLASDAKFSAFSDLFNEPKDDNKPKRDDIINEAYDYLYYKAFDKIDDILNSGSKLNVRQKYLDEISLAKDSFYTRAAQNKKLDDIDVSNTLDTLQDIVGRIIDDNISARFTSNDLLSAFVIPPEALTDDNSMKAELIQQKADALNTFRERYGVDASKLATGNYGNVSLFQRKKITTDMQIMGTDNPAIFVCRTLEGMLGIDWAVSEQYGTYTSDANGIPDKFMLNNWVNDVKDAYYFLDTRTRYSRYSRYSTDTYDEQRDGPYVFLAINKLANLYTKIYRDYRPFFDYLKSNTTYGKILKDMHGVLKSMHEMHKKGASTRKLLDYYDDESAYETVLAFQQMLENEAKQKEKPHVVDISIARKIPANALLSSTLFADTVTEQNNKITGMFFGDVTPEEYFNFYEKYDGKLEYFDEDEKRWLPLTKSGDDYINDDGVVIIIGEDEPSHKIRTATVNDEKDLSFMLTHPRELSITEFLRVKIPSIEDVSVRLEKTDREDLLGHFDVEAREIILFINENMLMHNSLLDTFAHETNHALQNSNDLYPGGNYKMMIWYRGALEHVLDNYWEYVAYVLRNVGLFGIVNVVNVNKQKSNDYKMTLDDLRQISGSAFPQVRQALQYCAYRLLQGELWAQHATHNKRPVTGYKRIFLDDKRMIVSPDGDTIFDEDGGAYSARVEQMMSAKSIDNMSFNSKRNLFVSTMRNILTARADASALGPRGTKFMHNKLHTSLNIAGKATEICDDLLSPDVSTIERVINSLYQIDTIITNPQFLNKEIKKRLDGDFSEGNVYYRIKEYVEEKYPGISIDRTQSHKYIFVSTNSFDDIIKPSLASKLDSKDFTLFNKYEGRTVTLSEFYKISELNKLGLIDVPVVFSSEVKTQAVRNSKYPNGAILIETGTNFMTDEVFLDKLNHEFRHLLQMYNKYELGFTRDIKVTREMIADVKAHVPELFEDKMLVENAKSLSKNNWEAEIVKSFIYYTTHGEMEAYGFVASILAAKPTYVEEEAGNPTIFMSWYNAKTGEGRYKTEYIAARAENAETVKLTAEQKAAQEAAQEKEKAKPKAEGGRINVSRKAAKGTNLEFFTNKLGPGEQLQMDVGLYDFIVATTDNLDKLPPELAEAITKGILNKDALFRWFRAGRENADKLFNKPTKSDPKYDEKLAKFVKDIEMYNKQYDYAFKLMNKYIFKNDFLTSENELSEFVNKDISQLWAAIRVARKHGLSEETLENEFAKHGSSGKKIQMLIDTMQTGDYANDFKAELRRWDRQAFDKKNGQGQVYKKVEYTEVLPFVRTTAMLIFNGTLASAYVVGDIVREDGKIYDEKKGILSYNATMSDKEGNAKEYGDNLSDANKLTETETDSLGNDILAIYLRTHKELTQDEMIDQLVPKYRERLIDKVISQKFEQVKNKDAVKELLSMTPTDFNKRFTTLENKEDLTDRELSRYKQLKIIKPYFEQIYQTLFDWVEKLRNRSLEEISAYYDKIITREANSVPQTDKSFEVTDEYDKFETRRQIQNAIKTRAKNIINWVTEKKLSLDDLPDDIKDMFGYEVFEDKRKKQYKVLVLKRDVYTVGPGKVALNKKTSGKGFSFTPEYDIEKDTGKYRHDTTEIKRNLVKLDKFYQEQTKIFKEQKLKKEQEERDAQRQLIKYRRDAEKRQNEIDIAVKRAVAQSKKKDDLKQTEITVKKRRDRLSDTPNYFTIVAGKEMPQKLYKIFDTSFTDMRNTAVQFVSKDENGEYYDRSKEKNFDSLVKHETANWDAFYEANRAELLELTREDILEFLEFFQSGMVTLDGPANKLEAFKVFMVGYIVDGARRNFNNWNFSDKEIATLEKLYESIASKAGSVLRAVRSMLKVVDPLKKIRQRMFDEWDAISDADKDDLIEAVDDMQTEKDVEKQQEKAQKVLNMLNEFERRQDARNEQNRPERFTKNWWANIYRQGESLRYVAMLSNPATWVRNQVSNYLVRETNRAADVVANIVFAKKQYREDQWDLSHVKISKEAKTFIDDNVLNNPVFDGEYEYVDKNGKTRKKHHDIYEMSSKHDFRHGGKIDKQLLVTLLTKNVESRFAAEHRFDSAAFNWMSGFIEKMISDKRFIKQAAIKYFGKILTIEAEKGNIDLSKGIADEKILNLFAEAIIQANRDYMHKRSALADMVDGIRDKHPALYEAITLWQPFLNSGINWFIEGVYKLTPIGLTHSIINMCKLEKRIAKVEERRAKGELVADSRFTEYLTRRDIGKGVLGTLFSTFAVILIMAGTMKIEEDDDKYYIVVGDVRVDVSDIFGSSTFLIAASIAQTWLDFDKETDNAGDTIGKMLGEVSNHLVDGFILNDIVERWRYQRTAYDTVLYEFESFLKSFVPQFWQVAIELTKNKKTRYSSSFAGVWERWLNSWVPFFSIGEKSIDPYTGEEQTKYALPIIGPILKKGLLGPKIFWYDFSEQEKLAMEYGIKKGELTGELTVNEKKYKLDRTTLNKVYGMLNEKSLTKIKSQSHKVEMPDGKYKTLAWDKLSDKQRARVIERTMERNADIAKIYIWTQKLGHKYYASETMFAELRKAGFTKNVYRGDKGFVE